MEEKTLFYNTLAFPKSYNEIETIDLTDIVNVNILQNIQDKFTKSLDIGSVILDTNLKQLTIPNEKLQICKTIQSTKSRIEKCKINKAKLLEVINKYRSIKEICPYFNNISNVAIPIFIEGKVIAIWLAWQKLAKKTLKKVIIDQVSKIGVNYEETIKVNNKHKPISVEKFNNIVHLLKAVSKNISLVGFHNLQQKCDKSRRIKAEKNLLKSEKRFKNHFNNEGVGLFRANMLDGKIIECNNLFASLYGYRTEKECICNYSTSQHYIDLNKQNILFSQLRKKGRISNFEIDIKVKDRPIIWVSLSATLNYGNNFYEGCIVEITELIVAENALKEKNEKFRMFFEKSDDAILVMDENKFIECNQSVLDMLGYNKKNKVLNKHPSKLSPEKQPDGESSFKKANKMIKIAIKKGSNNFEWIHKRANGEEFPLEIWLTAIPYNGKMIIHATWRDISEQKKTELELNKYRNHLEKLVKEKTAELVRYQEKLEDMVVERTIQFQQSEERYRILTEHSADSIMRFDTEHRYLYVNLSLEELTGISRDTFIGKTHAELGYSKYLCEIWNEALNKVLETKKKNRFEFVLPNNIWLDCTLVPEFDLRGKIDSILASARDITERKIAEEQKEHHLKETQELVELKTNFISTVSHEFRTPISTILSSSELLELCDGTWSIEKKRIHFDRIKNNIKNLIDMLNEVSILEKTSGKNSFLF